MFIQVSEKLFEINVLTLSVWGDNHPKCIRFGYYPACPVMFLYNGNGFAYSKKYIQDM